MGQSVMPTTVAESGPGQTDESETMDPAWSACETVTYGRWRPRWRNSLMLDGPTGGQRGAALTVQREVLQVTRQLVAEDPAVAEPLLAEHLLRFAEWAETIGLRSDAQAALLTNHQTLRTRRTGAPGHHGEIRPRRGDRRRGAPPATGFAASRPSR